MPRGIMAGDFGEEGENSDRKDYLQMHKSEQKRVELKTVEDSVNNNFEMISSRGFTASQRTR